MPSRNSSSNLLNFPYAHGMSTSQEALSSGVASSGVSKSTSKQSNFPFSRFFKSRGSNTSINNNNTSSNTINGHASAKSRPESPCRYPGSKSTSAVDIKQQQQGQSHRYTGLPLSSSSVSLASTVYANSGHAGDMVVDMTQTTSSSHTNYCVYVTASSADVSASSFRSTTTSSSSTTTTLKQQHLPPCDTNREIDLNCSPAAVAVAGGSGGATVSSNRHNNSNSNHSSHCNSLNNINHSSHHSKGGSISYGTTSAVHSINSYQTAAPAAGPQLPTSTSSAPGPQQPPTSVSAAEGGGVRREADSASSTTTTASCDKRVYVEKRIKTSDSEAADGGAGSGFKGMDQSV